jgi:hypothetical protein
MRVTILFLSLLTATSLNAQTISCGLWVDGTTPFQFVRVNMTDGTTVFNNPLPVLQSSAYETSFINPITGQYVIMANTPQRYYTIDINSGTVVNDVLAPDNVQAHKINPLTGTVYGLLFNGTTFDFVTVNTTTAAVTTVATLPGLDQYYGESAAFNDATNQYFFIGHYTADPPSTFRCFLVDATTGTIVSDAVAPDNLMAIQMDTDNNTLYALWFNGVAFEFNEVDPLTGVKTSLATLAGVDGLVLESTVFNPASDHYVFKGASGVANKYFTVDVTTGAIVTDVVEAEEILHLEFYVDSGSLSAGEIKNDITFSVYPNPSGSAVLLTSNDNFTGARVELYTAAGELIFSEDEICGNTYELKRNGLPAGLYFMNVVENGTVKFSDKLVWADQ